jgi:5-methyltetrahydrofolate--homocysteine methyltransferase
MNQVLHKIYRAILDGDMVATQTEVKAAVDAGASAAEILNTAMIPAMSEVGCLFEKEEYFVPEMLISARAMKAGLDIVRPLLVHSGVEPVGKVAIGTVKGDLHDIGKNLVAMMLEGAGFEIIDLGTDVPPEKFIEAIRSGANIIGLSALLTTTMLNMETTIKAIEAAGLRDKARIMVGGAPVTAEYSRRIGADGFASDASQAANVATSLLSQQIRNAVHE